MLANAVGIGARAGDPDLVAFALQLTRSPGPRPGSRPTRRWCGEPAGPGTGWLPTRRGGSGPGRRPDPPALQRPEQPQLRGGVGDRDLLRRQQPGLVAGIDAVLELPGLGQGLDRPQADDGLRPRVRRRLGRRAGRPPGRRRGRVGRGRGGRDLDDPGRGRRRRGRWVTGTLAACHSQGDKAQGDRSDGPDRSHGNLLASAAIYDRPGRSQAWRRPVTALPLIGLVLAAGWSLLGHGCHQRLGPAWSRAARPLGITDPAASPVASTPGGDMPRWELSTKDPARSYGWAGAQAGAPDSRAGAGETCRWTLASRLGDPGYEGWRTQDEASQQGAWRPHLLRPTGL
jgi:hypothetical protein